MPPFSEIKKELRYQRQRASSNRLSQTAKWIGELSISVTKAEDIEKNELIRNFISTNTDQNLRFGKVYREDLDSDAGDKLSLARDLYDLREFKKAAFIVREFAADPNHQDAMFIHHYALWMHGDMDMREKRYQQEYSIDGKGGSKYSPFNLYANNILEIFKPLYLKKELNDFNCYLFGLALREKGQHEEAIKAFIEAINQNPLLWTAWLEICSIINK